MERLLSSNTHDTLLSSNTHTYTYTYTNTYVHLYKHIRIHIHLHIYTQTHMITESPCVDVFVLLDLSIKHSQILKPT